MLEYPKLKRNRRKLLALTGLTLREFTALLPFFVEAYQQMYAGDQTLAGQKRQRLTGGGRCATLKTAEQKLLFILVYQKTYPLQVVIGELFGLSRSSANHWIHRLLPVLRDALSALGVMPERDGSQLARSERKQKQPPDYIIDGTERRRQRPKKPDQQALHYSGKKKTHSDKNVVIVRTRSKRVAYLSPTYAGKTHDKKVADCEQIAYPRKAILYQDTGFQGYEAKVQDCRQPKKAARQRTDPAREALQSCALACPGKSRACTFRGQTVALRQGHIAQHTSRVFRSFYGGGHWFAQSTRVPSQASSAAMSRIPYSR